MLQRGREARKTRMRGDTHREGRREEECHRYGDIEKAQGVDG